MILHSRTHRTVSPSLVVAAGAVASVLAWWWLSDGASPAPSATERSDATTSSTVAAAADLAPPVRATSISAPAKTVVPAAANPQAPPVQYIGRWVEGSKTAVVLGYKGRSVVVRVPGSLDERYEVISADDRQVVIKDNASGLTQGLPMSGDAGAGGRWASAAPAPVATPAVTAAAPTTVAPGVHVTPNGTPSAPRRSSSRDSEPEN